MGEGRLRTGSQEPGVDTWGGPIRSQEPRLLVPPPHPTPLHLPVRHKRAAGRGKRPLHLRGHKSPCHGDQRGPGVLFCVSSIAFNKKNPGV